MKSQTIYYINLYCNALGAIVTSNSAVPHNSMASAKAEAERYVRLLGYTYLTTATTWVCVNLLNAPQQSEVQHETA